MAPNLTVICPDLLPLQDVGSSIGEIDVDLSDDEMPDSPSNRRLGRKIKQLEENIRCVCVRMCACV